MKTIDQMTIAELKAWKPERVDMDVIREIADRIASAFDPEKIILFGSYARENASASSDVDLLVIAEGTLPMPQRSVPIYRLLRNYMIPIDVIVRTPDEIKRYEGLPFSFLQTVLREGMTLYERKA